jgi:hypothetical protein
MTQPIATTDTQEQPANASWDAVLKMPLQDWQVRLIQEAKDLHSNLDKLTVFINRIAGSNHKHEAALLDQQRAMTDYLTALKWRLRLEGISWKVVDPAYEELTER